MDRPHANNLRLGRVDEPGRIYLLTAVAAERQPLFLDLTQTRNCIRALRFQYEADRTSTLAYVLMPDHLHWQITEYGVIDGSHALGEKLFGANDQPAAG